MKKVVKHKSSSLFCPLVNDEEKKFDKIGTSWFGIQIIGETEKKKKNVFLKPILVFTR